MNKKYLAFSLITIFLFFLILEVIFRLFTVTGSYDYIERTIIQQGLKVHKQPGEFRVFLFGESTMHGSFLFPQSTIKKWMKLYLENLLGEEAKKITVINFGRLGCGSEFMRQSFKDTLVYKPDLVIFYSSHNDFIQLELRDDVLKSKPLADRFGQFMQELTKKSCFISTMKRVAVLGKIRKSKKKEKKSKDEWYEEEEKKFNPATDLMKPNSEEFLKVQRHWENNIGEMVKIAQSRQIPIMFFQSVSKYKDFKPFYSVHKKDLNPEQLIEWQHYFDKAETSLKYGHYFEAMTFYQSALKMDGDYALTYFRLGQCLEQLGDYNGAYNLYVQANDQDYMPIRAPSSANRFYTQLETEHLKDVYVIHTQEIFDQHSKNGLVDDELVADQLHPTVKGQALMAKEILRIIFENNLMINSKAWKWPQLRTFDELAQNIDIDLDFEFEIQLWLANYVGSYLDTAEQYVKKALTIKPDSIRAKSELAWVYWKAGRKDEARKLYQELKRQAPIQAKAFFEKHSQIAAEL